jgi:hypothetical protein
MAAPRHTLDCGTGKRAGRTDPIGGNTTPAQGAPASTQPDAYEPVLQVAEIMVTLDTVIDPPRPEPELELLVPLPEPLVDGEDELLLLLDGDDEDDDELLGDDEFSIELLLPPDMVPVTITW